MTKDKSKYLYELVLFWCSIYQQFEEELQLPIVNSILSEYYTYYNI